MVNLITMERNPPVHSTVIINITDLRKLRPKLDEVFSDIDRGFYSIVEWILLGTQGSYIWHSTDKDYLDEHIDTVIDEVISAWDDNYLDVSNVSYASTISDEYGYTIEYVRYVVSELVTRVAQYLQTNKEDDGCEVISFSLTQHYIEVAYGYIANL